MKASQGKQFRPRLKLEQFDQGVHCWQFTESVVLVWGNSSSLLSDHQKAKAKVKKDLTFHAYLGDNLHEM